ncbi:unnamed protein product [Penicillium egyptiacum]|uniref:Uncharacterized protein n=1 Tax=Penicillium egyptiacum TaxID=1303716 RepID=A0A9W4K8T4_9EURO|nr:unnamed protein product [Penicillium egyptiacum]
MPPKPSSRKGGKKRMSHTLSPRPSSSPIRKKQKGTPSTIRDRANCSPGPGIPKLEPSAGTHTPSEYWNQLADLQRDFLDGTTQEIVSNLYDFGAEIKAETPSPAPVSVANDENESEYSLDFSPVPGPISSPFPCTKDDLTLCHAPTADLTGYPIFVSRNGRWDWYYLASNNKTTESSAAPANGTTNGDAKNTKSEFSDDLSLCLNQFPCTEDDITLYPYPNPGPKSANSPTFSSQNGRWEWIFLPSNTITESSPPKVKMEDIPEANPRIQRPSNPVSTTFSAADLGHFVFHGDRDSDDDISTVPSLVENANRQARPENLAEQARTVKHVKFFMNNSHDKHFIPFEFPALVGNENWDPWLAGMYLLFRQHSVWPVVTASLQPLPPGHNLYLWYKRMCDCAVALIYANVSDVVRNTHCFMSALRDDDPDDLMAYLYAHYAEPGSVHPDEESELD